MKMWIYKITDQLVWCCNEPTAFYYILTYGDVAGTPLFRMVWMLSSQYRADA